MYPTICFALAGLSCLKLLPNSSPLKKHCTSFPLLLCIILQICSFLYEILNSDTDFYTIFPYLSILKAVFYSEYHTLCINFICWLQIIPFLYFSPEFTFEFETLNSIQYNYAGLLLFELSPVYKFYFAVNLISLLSIQIMYEMIESQKLAYKCVEIMIQSSVLYFTYEWGFEVTVIFICKYFFIPIISSGLAFFLEFFTFLYFYETLNDYKLFDFPKDARMKERIGGKGQKKVSAFDIFSHAYAFPVIFLMLFRLNSDVSVYMMLHVFLLISIPVSFKLSLVSKNFEYRSFALNTAAIFFSLVCYLIILGYFN